MAKAEVSRSLRTQRPAYGRVGVVIPSYDEVEGIRSLIPAVRALGIGGDVVVIVASDGSSDGTPIVAESLGAVVRHSSENRGKTAALSDGIGAALSLDCDPIVLIDGDGQHDPADMPALLAPILAGAADLVVGSRYLRDPRRGVTPLNRFVVRTVVSRLVSRMLGYTVTDPFCGYRALSRRAVDVVAFEGSRYQCELEMLFAVHAAGLAVTEVPVARCYGSGMTKMGAHYGRFIGRLVVLSQYVRAMTRGARTLRRSSMA